MKKILIVVAVVAVALIALGVAGFAFAQAQPPQPGEETQGPWGMMGGWRQAVPGGMMGRMGGGRFQNWKGVPGEFGPMHQYMLEALAEGLGLSADELQARLDAGATPYEVASSQGLSAEEITALFQNARTKALDKAVADEIITQEQADWMKDHMGQGAFGSRGSRMMRGLRGWANSPAVRSDMHDYKIDAFAVAFGLTSEDLNSRLNNGETMWEVAQSLGLTEEQFVEKRTEATQSAVNQALADGKITQEQADWIIARMSQSAGFGPGAGHCGGWNSRRP